MRLNEITQLDESKFLTDRNEVYSWLLKHLTDCDAARITIGDDGVVDAGGDVVIVGHEEIPGGKKLTTLPVKFGVVQGRFAAPFHSLSEFSWAPSKCDVLDIRSNNFSNLTNLPDVWYLVACNNPFTEIPYISRRLSMINLGPLQHIASLEGIADRIPAMRLDETEEQRIYYSFSKITRGGLGLLLIENLQAIYELATRLSPPFQIIEKYLGRPDDIFECQAELIENGYEEFTVL